MSSPKITRNQKIGFLGEALIALRLSEIALVSRYVKDVGLDFYCETLFDEKPGYTFFVQAKGTEQLDENWGVQIPVSTINYWLERPGPVYLFVADIQNERTYWKSIEEKRHWFYEQVNKTGKKSIYLEISRDNELNKDNHGNFITALNSDVTSFYTNMGIPPIVGRGYIRQVPPFKFTNQQWILIFDTARFSLYHLIQDSMARGEYPEAKRLIDGLITMGSKHASNYTLLAEVYSGLGDDSKSLEKYKEALRVINEDPKFLSIREGQLQKESVEKKIGELESKLGKK